MIRIEISLNRHLSCNVLIKSFLGDLSKNMTLFHFIVKILPLTGMPTKYSKGPHLNPDHGLGDLVVIGML